MSVFRLAEDKVMVQWESSDTSLRQISIQQSSDSLAGFRSILTIPDPRLSQNGSIIQRAGAALHYYRLYLLYPMGHYRFTVASLPIPLPADIPKSLLGNQPPREIPEKKQIRSAFNPDSVSLRSFPIRYKGPEKKDTTARVSPQVGTLPKLQPGERIEIKKVEGVSVDPDKFTPSLWVYTHRDGYPFVQLPVNWNLSQVRILFFNQNGEKLFELTHPPLHSFRIDKTNFQRSGWYSFEVWVKGKKIESNRLYLPLEF